MTCSICGNEFLKPQRQKFDYCSVACRNRIYYLRDRVALIGKQRVYDQKNRPEVLARKRQQWYDLKADPQKYDEYKSKRKANGKWHRLRRKYGLTREQYEAMIETQNGLCAICKQPFKNTHSIRKPTKETPVVDHNHATGNIRSLLCNRCNQGIGHFEENPEVMRAAAEYIELWKNK